jgi:3-polyprenyl-4-hydroxybenzoate decarboxylase
VKTESAAWAGLVTAVREPVAVFATPSSGGMYNVRVSLRQRVPGEARNAIAAVFGSMAEAKQVFVFDEDIDVFSDEQCDWALATRYQGDRDTLGGSGFRVVPLDPSLGGARTGAKIGFDCTVPFGKRQSLEWGVPAPPVMSGNGQGANGRRSAAEVLAQGPASFLELMAAAGSRDGREIVRELDKLYASDKLTRNESGKYALKGK